MLTFLSAVAFLAVLVLAIVIASFVVAAIRSRKR
jgi:hypothetical protein